PRRCSAASRCGRPCSRCWARPHLRRSRASFGPGQSRTTPRPPAEDTQPRTEVLRPGADAVQQNDFNQLKLARPAQCAHYMDSPYLYADGTPFPLRANFIELLRDSVDCAVELLRIAERAEGARELRAEAERRSCRALENLAELEAAVSDAVLGGDPACQRAAERIREAAARAIGDERAVLTQDMVNATAAIDRESSGERAKMLAVLEKLLHKHDLPDTESAIDLELP